MNATSIQTSIVTPKESPKSRRLQSIGASIVGLSLLPSINYAKNILTPIAINSLKSYNELPADEIQRGINLALEQSKLAEKGVTILTLKADKNFSYNEFIQKVEEIRKNIKLSPEAFKSLSRVMSEESILLDRIDNPTLRADIKGYNLLKQIINKAPFGTQSLKDKNLEKIFTETKKGLNGFFSPLKNTIIVPDSIRACAFHEMGHALNFNSCKYGKALMLSRLTKLLATPAIILAILTKNTYPNDGETDIGTGGKIKNMIRNNIGKLAILCWLPIILDESVATIKGNKLAKQVLSPQLAKKVAKCNRLAGTSYILGAAITGFTAWLGVQFKNALTDN